MDDLRQPKPKMQMSGPLWRADPASLTARTTETGTAAGPTLVGYCTGTAVLCACARPAMRAPAPAERAAGRGPDQPPPGPSSLPSAAAVALADPPAMLAAAPAHTSQAPFQEPTDSPALGEGQPGTSAPTLQQPSQQPAPPALPDPSYAYGASNDFVELMQVNQCGDIQTSTTLIFSPPRTTMGPLTVQVAATYPVALCIAHDGTLYINPSNLTRYHACLCTILAK